MNTDDLIARLGREATPVRRLPSVNTRTAVWGVAAAIYLVVAIAFQLDAGAARRVALTPLYLIEQSAGILLAIAAARAALLSTIPGHPGGLWRVPLVLAATWLALLLFDAAATGATFAAAVRARREWSCITSIAVGGAVLGAPLVVMLRRGAPLTPRLAAFWGGVAALSIANVESCLTHPHGSSLTVLLWHGAALLLLAGACGVTGRRWFAWRSRAVAA